MRWALLFACAVAPSLALSPLFPARNGSSLQFLHTSFATLLPILPRLAPAPTHTLLVTLATPAFKPLLFNWICWLRYKARWGAQHDDADADVLKLLVFTSDEGLSRELSEQGVVVWWLRGIDLDATNAVPDDASLLLHDLFLNLRLADLLLPSATPDDANPRQNMLKWGTLHYQSLMLERTLVLATLVGSLAENQRVEAEDRLREEQDWRRRVLAHDWESSRLEKEPFVGVKGVLVVDNDAVWLSSPNSFLAHPYRPDGTHPSIIYAPDSSPFTANAWGTHEMPCACFFYSRTSDDDAATSPPAPTLDDEELDYRPSEGAALAWKYTALCHISMLLKSLETGRRYASAFESAAKDDLVALTKAQAPSFQATSLGPALYLASQKFPILPKISATTWTRALGSGDVEDLYALLEEAGLDDGETTCIELAQKNYNISPNPLASPNTLSTTPPHRPLRTEPLPYSSFPPGMSFFSHDQESGIRPCVVHANYATGSRKEELLRREGLWALRGDDEEGYTCDEGVMSSR